MQDCECGTSYLFIIRQHRHPIWPVVSRSWGGTTTEQLNFNHTINSTAAELQNDKTLLERHAQVCFRQMTLSRQCQSSCNKGKVTVGSTVIGLHNDTHRLWQSLRLLLIGQFTTPDMWALFKWGPFFSGLSWRFHLISQVFCFALGLDGVWTRGWKLCLPEAPIKMLLPSITVVCERVLKSVYLCAGLEWPFLSWWCVSPGFGISLPG